VKLVEREPEELDPDDDGGGKDDYDEPEQDNRPRSDEEVKSEFGTL